MSTDGATWLRAGFADRPARQRGTTLVELVIAMTVALLVLGTVGLIFGGTSRNRASLERAARLADNASYAMEVIRNDVAQAGYYDTLTTTAGGFTWQVRDPCVTALAISAGRIRSARRRR